MAVSGFFKYARLALFSKESSERQLIRLVKKQQTRRVVELGISSLERTTELLTQAAKTSPEAKIQYSGFDFFEERPSSLESLSLIETHRTLAKSEIAYRLTPGSPSDGLAAMANSLPDTDMLLISDLISDAQLEPIWFYLPRMCHPGTIVLRKASKPQENQEAPEWETISLTEVDRLANYSVSRVAA